MAESWAQCVRDIGSSSANRRRAAWAKLRREAGELSRVEHVASSSWARSDTHHDSIAGDERGFECEAERVVLALESSLHVYSDRMSKQLLVSTIESWLGEEAFIKSSVAALVFREKDIAKHGYSSHERQTYMAWTCMILDKLMALGEKKATNRLVAIANHLLNAALADMVHLPRGDKIWSAHKQYVLALLRASGEKRAKVLDLFFAEAGGAGLVRLVSEFGSKDGGIRSKLMGLYVERVIGAKTAPGDVAIASFEPLTASLTLSEFKTEVMPSVTKMLKRTPEIIIKTLVSVLPKLTASLDVTACDLMAAFVSQLQASDQSNRDDAVLAAQALCSRIEDMQVFEQLQKTLVESMDSKKLRNWNERQSAVLIIGTLVKCGIKAKLPQSFVDGAASSLLGCCGKESNESVKKEIITALIEVGPHVGHLEASDVNAIKGLMANKGDLKSCGILCVATLAGNPMTAQAMLDLKGTLVSTLGDSLQKPASTSHFPATMVALAFLARHDKSIWGAVEEAKLADKITDGTASVWTQATLERLGEQESVFMVYLCRDLLLMTTPIDVGDITDCLCRNLLLLSLHDSKDVRSNATRAIQQCSITSTDLGCAFLTKFRTLLSEGMDDEDFQSSRMVQRATYCLVSLVPVTLSLYNSSLLVDVLMLVNHDFFRWKPKRLSVAWQGVLLRLKALGKLDQVLDPFVPEMVAQLVGSKGLASVNEDDWECAVKSFANVASFSCPSFVRHFLSSLLAMEEFEAHQSLTPNELKVSIQTQLYTHRPSQVQMMSLGYYFVV